jgi:F-type H+-transporting ATPase subunit delta
VSRRTAEVGARVYAEALAEAAEATGLLDRVGEELAAVANRPPEEGSLVNAFFNSSAVRQDQKMAKVEAAFRGRASDLFTDFLLVLLRRNRIELLRPIARAYQAILDERGAKAPVTITTAAAADPADVEKWAARLAPALAGRRPVAKHRVDPALIGGMVVRTGDWVADGSIRRILQDLRARLAQAGRTSLSR